MSEARTVATYTLPTPEVSPLEPTPRPLDYQTYGSLAPHPDRFSFDGGSLTGELYQLSDQVQFAKDKHKLAILIWTC